jgi:hypothetical protein
VQLQKVTALNSMFHPLKNLARERHLESEVGLRGLACYLVEETVMAMVLGSELEQ